MFEEQRFGLISLMLKKPMGAEFNVTCDDGFFIAHVISFSIFKSMLCAYNYHVE